jgi:hypothetical protein
MPVYELYGRALDSDMAFPELRQASPSTAPGYRFTRGLPPPHQGEWFVIWWRPDGDPWVRASKTPRGYRIQYCNCAEFDVDAVQRVIAGETIDCSEEMFRHFLVDQVAALAWSLESTVLHASSVAIDGRALVAFAGPGGAGKSTLATALARHGHAIASDDALQVRVTDAGVRAVPAYPGVRLWNDSEAEVAAGLAGDGRPEAVAKQRFNRGLPFSGEGTLVRLYVLDPAPASATRFERLTGRDAVVELVRQTYRLALDDRQALAREFAALAEVAARVGCWRLSYPRDLAGWRGLAADVEAHIRAGSTVAA